MTSFYTEFAFRFSCFYGNMNFRNLFATDKRRLLPVSFTWSLQSNAIEKHS